MQQIASFAQLRASIMRWSLFTVPLCVGLGLLSAAASGSGPADPWFAGLDKPAIYPPPIAFPLVWTALYVLMGFSLALLAVARGSRGRTSAVVAFAVQFAINLAWSPVFFGWHRITLALAIILVLIIATVIAIALAWRVRRLAGALLIPYLLWLCFASLLNLQFLQMNPYADGAAAPAPVVRMTL